MFNGVLSFQPDVTDPSTFCDLHHLPQLLHSLSSRQLVSLLSPLPAVLNKIPFYLPQRTNATPDYLFLGSEKTVQ